MNVIARWSTTVLIAVGLGVDAYNHLHVAHNYAMNKTSTVSEATLFRIEAVLAIAAAVLVIVWANRWTAALALAVAGGGLVLLVVYRYHDVGQVGPLPDMYEPSWAIPGKKWTVVGEAIAVVGSLGLLSSAVLGSRRART